MDFDFFVEHVLSLSCQGTEAVLLLEAQVCIPTMPRMAESELKLHSAVSSFGWFVLQSWESKSSLLRPEAYPN